MTTAQLDALGIVIPMLGRVRDPRERIAAIVTVRAELRRSDERIIDLLRDALLELRALDPPATWAECGDLLGTSGQYAYQLVAERFAKKGNPDD